MNLAVAPAPIAGALMGAYPLERQHTPSLAETLQIFDPVRRSINDLRGEVFTIRGYPAFLDWQGHLSRIDHALLGWIGAWKRMAPDIDQRPLEKLERKLANGVLIDERDLDAALAVLDRQMGRFMTLPTQAIQSHTTTELINIELESLGIKEAA